MFHRAPGSIGSSAFPSRVFKGMRGAGHMGDAPGHRQEPEGDPHRQGQEPAHGARRRSGRRGRGGDASQVEGREARGQELTVGTAMAQIPVRDWNNKTLRTLELDEAVFGYPLKEHLIYEAVCAYRAGGSERHPQDQEPQRGQRRNEEALEAEAHRPRPRRRQPLAAVAPRRNDPRPGPARLQLEFPGRDAAERDQVGAGAEAARRADRVRRRLRAADAEDEGPRRRAVGKARRDPEGASAPAGRRHQPRSARRATTRA